MSERRQGNCGTCGRELPVRIPGAPGRDKAYCPHPDGGRNKSECQRYAALVGELKGLTFSIAEKLPSALQGRARARMARWAKDLVVTVAQSFGTP